VVAGLDGRDDTGQMRRRIALAVVLGALLTGCTDEPRSAELGEPSAASAEPSGADERSLADVAAATEERISLFDGIATGVIALVRVGDQTEVITAGHAWRRGRVAMAPEMRFPIASITKAMTATLVMELVEEGRVALDDPAQRWVPEVRSLPPITIAQLLSHRSGLPDSTGADIAKVGLDTRKLVARSVAHGLEFPPGSRGNYSNVGYGALQLVLERIHHRSFSALLERRIFDPAGMGSSSLFGRPDVHGYVDGKDAAGHYLLRLLPAAGSVVSTVQDVDAFFRGLWADRLVASRYVADMATPRGSLLEFNDYGLGIVVRKVSCGKALGHSGRLTGFSIDAYTLEDSDRSTVIMVNDHLSVAIASIVETALCG
jgi:D-alanyl-D-alanine carboxypeptidase